ncbi:MAG: biotin/lipoyl-binding protein [Candidatus Dormiibacterota bacterium]
MESNIPTGPAPATTSAPALRRSSTRSRWLRGNRLWVIILVVVALALAALIGQQTILKPASTSTAPRIVTVTTGDVKASVSGTGALTPISQLNLNFRTSGQITEMDVKVGDHVSAGQTLAKVDSTTQQSTLASAQASLQSAQAAVQIAQNPVTSAQVAQLLHGVQAAQTNYNDTVNSVNATNNGDGQTVQSDQAAVNKAQNDYNTNSCGTASPAAGCAGPTGFTATLQNAQSKLATDQQKQTSDQIAGQTRLDQAQQQITSAQDNLNVQSQVKPNAVASAQAQLASAQAQVQSAQMTLDQTTLKAPTDGTVVSVTGNVGETSGGGGSSTSQAPGSNAPLTGGSSGSSGTGSSSSSSSSSSSATVVLASAAGFQAVVPFPESDASKLVPNQDVNLTYDAIPNLNVAGKVLAVAPTATVVSNVVNYYATIVVDSTDSRLKSGMTTNASVTIQSALGVLSLPNTAVQNTGGSSTVNLVRNGQQTSVPVTTGLVGDSTTEIRAGLNDGDQVALPQARTSATPAAGGGGGGGGGRGFGGGF